MGPGTFFKIWRFLSPLPGGRWLASRLLGVFVPYTGTMGAVIVDWNVGSARAILRDRRRVRNHLKCVHAIALMNLAEMVSGISVLSALPPGGRFIIKKLDIEFLKKARGTLSASAEAPVISSLEKQVFTIPVDVRNEIGELVCQAHSTVQVGD